jgi:transcription initiation factor TFIIE subunit alpha
MESDEEELTPTVSVGGRSYSVTAINDELIAKMTPVEKEAYIHVYQEHYSHMYD